MPEETNKGQSHADSTLRKEYALIVHIHPWSSEYPVDSAGREKYQGNAVKFAHQTTSMWK